jgi:hypothetical protein
MTLRRILISGLAFAFSIPACAQNFSSLSGQWMSEEAAGKPITVRRTSPDRWDTNIPGFGRTVITSSSAFEGSDIRAEIFYSRDLPAQSGGEGKYLVCHYSVKFQSYKEMTWSTKDGASDPCPRSICFTRVLFPKPGDMKGIYVSYLRTRSDGDTISNALRGAGIQFETQDSIFPREKSNTLQCTPDVPKEAIVKVALALFEAGIELKKIVPGVFHENGEDLYPSIAIISDADENASSLTRDQILMIDDCKKEYSSRSYLKGRRVVFVDYDCPGAALDIFYTYHDGEYDQWSSVQHMHFENKAIEILKDKMSMPLLIENYFIYYFATADLNGRRFYWQGQKNDKESAVREAAEFGPRYFKKYRFRQPERGLKLSLECPVSSR